MRLCQPASVHGSQGRFACQVCGREFTVNYQLEVTQAECPGSPPPRPCEYERIADQLHKCIRCGHVATVEPPPPRNCTGVRGLGDVISVVTHKTGIHQAVKAVFGDCGCDGRREALNRAIPLQVDNVEESG